MEPKDSKKLNSEEIPIITTNSRTDTGLCAILMAMCIGKGLNRVNCTMEKLSKDARQCSDGYILPMGLVYALERQGFKATLYSNEDSLDLNSEERKSNLKILKNKVKKDSQKSSKNLDLEEITHQMDQGLVPVVQVYDNNRNLLIYITLTGHDKSEIKYNYPIGKYMSSRRTISKKDFKQLWEAVGKTTLIIYPKYGRDNELNGNGNISTKTTDKCSKKISPRDAVDTFMNSLDKKLSDKSEDNFDKKLGYVKNSIPKGLKKRKKRTKKSSLYE